MKAVSLFLLSAGQMCDHVMEKGDRKQRTLAKIWCHSDLAAVMASLLDR